MDSDSPSVLISVIVTTSIIIVIGIIYCCFKKKWYQCDRMQPYSTDPSIYRTFSTTALLTTDRTPHAPISRYHPRVAPAPVTIDIDETPIRPKIVPFVPPPSRDCPEQTRCITYARMLRLNPNYFNHKFNRCYCSTCYRHSDSDYFTAGGSRYTIPRGWTRLGLKIDQAFANHKQIFTRWCTTFYGTSEDQLESIIKNRFIPFPGDDLLSGETFTTNLSDKSHVYTSPSINYASLKHVCPIDEVEIDGEQYDVQVVLECKQNPVGISKQHGCRRRVCSVIDDDEIEWKTDQRSSVVPYAILFRMVKHRTVNDRTTFDNPPYDFYRHSPTPVIEPVDRDAYSETRSISTDNEVTYESDETNETESCQESVCRQYSISRLGLPKIYFNFEYNRCYCVSCYSHSEPDYFTVGGSRYTIPRGWTRFGLKIDQAFANHKEIFKHWCTTFYGTSEDQVETVIKNRFIPFPGDDLLSGETFTTHLSDKSHIYTSPSINYASLEHVCPIDEVEIEGEQYNVQVVLECKQNPAGIIKQHGCRRDVCSVIDDDEIEWKTDQRSSVVPYGLLIRAIKDN